MTEHEKRDDVERTRETVRLQREAAAARAPEAKLETQECRDCDGYGWNEGGAYLKNTCKTCNGSGVVPAARTQPETSNG